MPARKAIPPRSRESVAPNDVDDPKVSRALTTIAEAVARLQERAGHQAVVQDLEVGINTVRHALGRRPTVCLVTPTVADPSFAFSAALTAGDADRQVLVTILGVDQPGASVLLL